MDIKLLFKKYKTHILCLIFITIFLLAYFNYNKKVPFPPTLVINLDDRPDRFNEVAAEFNDWPMPIERISAVKKSPGYKGCFLSHIKCIKTAKERGYPWVLIVEDDCMLEENAITRFQNLLPYLWENKANWDIFNGGVASVKSSKVIDHDKKVFEVKGHCTQFYLAHTDTYDKILNNAEEYFSKPVDVYYKITLRTWTVLPFIAIQRPNHSDIGNDHHDYTSAFKRAEAAILKSIK
jgi:glycosyl transferase family 25